MDSSHIDLAGSRIAEITAEGSTIRVVFERAYIVKSMTGSRERTRWSQAGTLVLEGVSEIPKLPAGPLECAGGDIEENVYTYRNMIPLPFASRGRIRCVLDFAGDGGRLDALGTAVRLDMVDVPKYIEHIRP